MGKSKKFVLASVISSVLVLAFMIGLAPNHDAPKAGAATNGRINMVDLLTAAGFSNGDEKIVGVTIDSSLHGYTLKVSMENPPAALPIPVTATSGNDEVYYGAQTEGPNFFGTNTWSGPVMSGPFVSPFDGSIDVASFLTGSVSTTSLALYAFGVNTSKALFIYDDVNDPMDRVQLALSEVETGIITDSDANGYPLNPFTFVGPNEIWATTVTTNGEERTVFITNLDVPTKGTPDPSVSVNPTPDISILAPTLADLVSNGMVAPGESALLVVEVVSDLAGLLDLADGDSSGGALDAWGASTAGLQPGNLLEFAQYIEISLIHTQSGGTVWDEIDTLTGPLHIDLTISNLATPDGALELHSLPTLLIDGAPFTKGGTVGGFFDLNLTNVPGPQVWSEVPNVTVVNNELSVSLTSLSVFAPLDVAGVRVDSISPDSTPFGPSIGATITGLFGNIVGMTAIEAAATYGVYLNGVELTFNDILKGGHAIAPRASLVTPTNMAVQIPASLPVGLYDVTVSSRVNLTKTDTLVDGFEVLGNFTLTYDVGGTGFGNVDSTELSKGLYPVDVGPLVLGTEVELVATPNLGSAFVGWTGETANLSSTSNPTTIWTALASDSVVATFNLLYNCYSIYVDSDGNGVAAITGASSGECAIDSYPEGTVVSIEAVPSAGYIFSHWEGGVDGPNDAVTTITLDENENVRAFFTPAGSPVLLSVTPDSAWIFGGLIARATGINLTVGTDVIVGGLLVPGFNHDPGGTYVDFEVPRTLNGANTAIVLADVAVINTIGMTTIPNGFTYKRHQVNGSVNESAAIIDTAGGTVQVTLGSPHADFAQIEIPPMSLAKGEAPVYVIARNAQPDPAKGSPTSDLGTDAINEGTVIPGAYDFSIHFYMDTGAKGTSPAVGSATFTDMTNVLIDNNFVERPIDALGDPQASTPMLLTAPLTDSSLNNGDIRNSVTIWSTSVDYDYVAESVISSKGSGPLVQYNSEVYNNEVDPAISAGSSNGASPDLLDQARLHVLNGFSLRQNAILPTDDATGIRLTEVSGTGEGPTSGGTQLTLISPIGDLANIDRIEVVETGTSKSLESFPLDTKGGGPQLVLVTLPGTDEYVLDVVTPPFGTAGIVDFVIYGKGNPGIPLVTLEGAFEYTKTGNSNYLLTCLGFLMALLGISLGEGGSPCFIATAAYGTPLAGEIDVLREVRDTYLLDNALGSAFVDSYYHVSPYIADAVASSPVLAAVVRGILVPVIFIGKMALHTPALTGFIVLALSILYMRRRKVRAQS